MKKLFVIMAVACAALMVSCGSNSVKNKAIYFAEKLAEAELADSDAQESMIEEEMEKYLDGLTIAEEELFEEIFSIKYEAIMEGAYGKDIFEGTFAEELMKLLGEMAYNKVFTTPDIYRMEVAESVILKFLMDQFVNAVLYYDTDVKLGEIEKRVVSFISENYKSAYHKQAEGKSEAEKLYLRLLLVTDYICGMTDSYATRLYQELNAMVY